MNIDLILVLFATRRLCVCLFLLASTVANAAEKPGVSLSSGEYFIQQSWSQGSQEQNFQRTYQVRVPANPDDRKFPVFIFLHGNGGNAQGAMNGFLKQYPTMAGSYVMAFPGGYLKN